MSTHVIFNPADGQFVTGYDPSTRPAADWGTDPKQAWAQSEHAARNRASMIAGIHGVTLEVLTIRDGRAARAAYMAREIVAQAKAKSEAYEAKDEAEFKRRLRWSEARSVLVIASEGRHGSRIGGRWGRGKTTAEAAQQCLECGGRCTSFATIHLVLGDDHAEVDEHGSILGEPGADILLIGSVTKLSALLAPKKPSKS